MLYTPLNKSILEPLTANLPVETVRPVSRHSYYGLFNRLFGESEKGSRVVNAGRSGVFEITAGDDLRIVNWSRPVVFYPILVNGVFPEDRVKFLKRICQESSAYRFRSFEELDIVKHLVAEGKTYSKRADAGAAFKSAVAVRSADSESRQLTLAAAITDYGYKLTSSHNLVTRNKCLTEYNFTANGLPLNINAGPEESAENPVDPLVVTGFPLVDRLLWIKREGIWEEYKRISFSINGEASESNKFNDIVGKLMLATGMKTEGRMILRGQ